MKILGEDEEVSKVKVKRRFLRELHQNKLLGKTPMLGDSSTLVADCREESEQVYKDIIDWLTYDAYTIIIQPVQPSPEYAVYRKAITQVILRSGQRQWELNPLYETKIRPIQDEALDPVRPYSLLVAYGRILSRINEELTLKARPQCTKKV